MASLKRGRLKMAILFLYSAAALAMHCVAVKLVCGRTGLLLMANELPVQDKMGLKAKADLMSQYSGYFTTAFFLFCYGFLLFAGILLVINRLSLREYFYGILYFWLIQGIGILVFVRLTDTYGMTGLVGRLSFVTRQNLTRELILTSLILYGVRAFLRKARK